MTKSDFVHLHVHTEFSLLDGQSKIKKITQRAAELNMDALAITDHGVMFGAIDFFRAANAAEIKPIIGMEAYLAPRSRFDKDPQLDKKPYHLLLLARNKDGYRNLLKLASAAQLEGYYYRPRIDWEILEQYADGIIATSGCLAAEIPRMVEDGKDDQAYELIGKYQEVFGAENFYLELQPHQIDQLHVLNQWLFDYRKSGHTPVQFLATNDVHYVNQSDWDAHDTLLCIQTNAVKNETNRMRMSPQDSYYLKTTDEMRTEFGDAPPEMIREAFANTLKVADMCDVDLSTKGYHLPVFPVPGDYDEASYLRYLVQKGLDWRFQDRKNDSVIQERIERELGIIHDMGFDTYFLIVWDLCEFARHADIWWNVRGSGAGSLVAYCLGITNIDPIQNSLLFERFLNPGRVSMPDIDLDYPDDRRGEMIAYAASKYGEDKVAAIITFGTMGAKAAIRDVGRALNVPLSTINKAVSLIPTEARQKKIQEYVDANPELKVMVDQDPELKMVIDTAIELQGMTRHASTHAAGVIVSDAPLVNYLPLHRITGTDPSGGALKAVTQFPMETAESIGLLKVDFLGLSTLTILRKACDLIEKHRDIKYTMDTIPYRHDDDRLTDEQRQMLTEAFKMMGRGETVGVFQVESGGMQQMLRGMRPQKFEHIIAGISLYRPGPMDFIPTYNDRLHGIKETEFLHPKLESILAETYGILVYQEQIMQVAGELFGYALGEADLMRRAVSKKKKKALLDHKQIFMERGPENGISAEISEKIFDDIEFFANYGFNKCVVGSTKIIDADTGQMHTIQALFDGDVQFKRTFSLNTDNLHLQPAEIVDVMANGVKPVYRLTTQSGRSIEATANHPFYCFDGWRNLGDLQVGDQIALPRQITVKGKKYWDEHRLIVLGHLLAEGNLCHPTGIYFYTGDEDEWNDYVKYLEKFDNTVASTHERRGMYDVYSKRINRSYPSEVVLWIEELGLRNHNALNKFIPSEVFELGNQQIALLISRMWGGDGHINVNGRSLYYATTSIQLANQLQHLLLRLGIISKLRNVDFPYRGQIRKGYQVFVTGKTNLERFYELIGQYLVKSSSHEKFMELLSVDIGKISVKDVIPVEIKHAVRYEKELAGLTWDEIGHQTGLSTSTFSRMKNGLKSGFSRDLIGQFADYFNSTKLRTYAESDVYWDKVASIEYVGEQPTYDLTIADNHNFVANDIIVHNSHASDYAVITVQTAFLKTHYPEEYMTALLCVQFDDSTKVATFLDECRRLNIEILPPDLNKSMIDFDIETKDDGTRAIRFGLGAIKNAGVSSLEYLLEKRSQHGEFASLEEFCHQVDLRVLGKRTLESLIKVGALDNFATRHVLHQALDRIMGFSADYHKDLEVGQMNMFGEMMGGEMNMLNLPQTDEISHAQRREQLQWERELLGLYVTGRPVDRYKDQLRHLNTWAIAQLKDPEVGKVEDVRVAGEIMAIRHIITKNNENMAVLHLEDWHDSGGAIDVVLFPRTYRKVKAEFDEMERELAEGEIVMVIGKFDTSRGDPQIIGDRITTNFDVFVPQNNQQEDKFSNEQPAWIDDAPPPEFYEDAEGTVASSQEPPLMFTNGTDYAEQETYSSNGINGQHDEPLWANGSDDEDTIILDLHVGTEQDTTYFLKVYFPRTDDTDRDRRRLRRIHRTLTQYPGKDSFAIVIKTGNGALPIEFPKHTTGYCDDLMMELIEIVGEENIELTSSEG